MERDPEELQFLDLFGICSEAHHLLLSHRRLFAQITLALILPLAFISLAHLHISHLLFSTIHLTELALHASPTSSHLLARLNHEFTLLLLFKSLYLLSVLALSLLSTSAVVFSIASFYTTRPPLSFADLLPVIPTVWRRLLLTFLYASLLLAGYHIAALLLVSIALILLGPGTLGLAAVSLLLVTYAAGLVRISVVWHVASVVSVLEDSCGIEAMRKSRALVRGKHGVAAGAFLVLNVAFVGIEMGYRALVVEGVEGTWLMRIGCAGMLLSLLALLILMGLVMQTVIYFVCKSYHHERIDKSSLSDHLEVYLLGEYAPLKGKEVQMQELYV